MRIRSLLTVALLAIGTSPLLADQAAVLSAPDETSIRDLESRSWVAWQTHDAAFFEGFLSPDHVEVHGYGIVGKPAVVKGVGDGGCVVRRYSLGPFSLTPVAADSVLVTYRAEQDTLCGTVKVPSPVWATSLYVKRAGKWLNVLYQHTPVT